jgi:hypothetical protein
LLLRFVFTEIRSPRDGQVALDTHQASGQDRYK